MPTTEFSIEARLHSLEKQLKRQKITTLALFLGAVVAVSATRVVSQSVSQNSTSSLTLKTLKIVGADGKTKVLLSGEAPLNRDGGAIALFDNRGKARVGLMAATQGGSVSMFREDGEPMTILGFDGAGGTLKLVSNGSKTQVNLAATKTVSGLVVAGPNGKPHLVAGADKAGGIVQLFDVEGKLKRQMP